MSARIQTRCRKCGKLHRNPDGFCGDGCRPKRTSKPHDPESRKARGYGKRWDRMSRWYLAQHPVCEACGQRASTETDHIVPRAVDPAGIFDPDNFQALCSECHKEKTRRERKGIQRRGQTSETN